MHLNTIPLIGPDSFTNVHSVQLVFSKWGTLVYQWITYSIEDSVKQSLLMHPIGVSLRVPVANSIFITSLTLLFIGGNKA